MLPSGMAKSNQRSRFDQAIKVTIRERDKLELERLSETLDMDPRQLGRISCCAACNWSPSTASTSARNILQPNSHAREATNDHPGDTEPQTEFFF
jgi:hypothetical protein